MTDVFKKKLMFKGAEASLYYGVWFGKEVIFKHRIPKKYRIKELDKRIRRARTLNEAKALIKVKNYGLNVPQVYEIDAKNATIVMKYVEGDKLKKILAKIDDQKRQKYLFEVGQIIARLHLNGHIHGDITTSNILITKEEAIFLIDFGLHEYSDSIEDKSVDMHLFKRVLISTHGVFFKSCYDSFLEGYRAEYGEDRKKQCEAIIKNISVVETRGRYVKKKERL